MRKLNLTTEIEVIQVSRNPQTGEETANVTKVPASKFVLQGLERSQTFAEAKFKTGIIEKINAGSPSFEVNDAEYAAITQTLMGLTSTQKAAFAEMVMKLNPEMTIENV